MESQSARSTSQRRLKVVFCWHMHQPDYRDYRSGQYQLPWTYLHVIKDYVDMAAHLEKNPQARAVINFTPILLQQIDDYSRQVQRYFSHNEVIKDPLLHALTDSTLPTGLEHRHALIKACLRANEKRLINRFMPYQRLATMGRWVGEHPDSIVYLSGQYFADLVTWYHLAWLGETVRRDNSLIKALLEKGSGFTLHDRRELLKVIGDLLATVIGRYRTLADQGQIELSCSPYAHPIIPLLVDIQCARQALPDIALPVMGNYPGGSERARWHLQRSIDIFEQYFARKPSGCWLSEGGVSEAAVALLDQMGLQWTASGEGVLRNSLQRSSNLQNRSKNTFLYQPYQLRDVNVACFFRDDHLSDLIGFTYFDWHGDHAAADLVNRLVAIAEDPRTPADAVVSIIMDGENAWEHYPENGYYFLTALYRAIVNHPLLELTTFTDCLHSRSKPEALSELVAGSWVYGTFSTWVGDEEKNRGWNMLAEVKHCYDSVMAKGCLDEQQRMLAEQQLATCESSDWFWWFGGYNPAETVSDFERLFRMHLTNLYQYLGQEPPGYLAEVFTHGSGKPLHGGVMRTATE